MTNEPIANFCCRSQPVRAVGIISIETDLLQKRDERNPRCANLALLDCGIVYASPPLCRDHFLSAPEPWHSYTA